MNNDCKSDPLDTPLPCDVQVGHMTFRKGVALRSLVLHANRLRDEVHQRWAGALADCMKAPEISSYDAASLYCWNIPPEPPAAGQDQRARKGGKSNG